MAASDTISWAFARAVQRPFPVRGGSIWVNAYLSDPSPRTLFAVATMTAIVHDDYGTIPEDVLRLEEVGKPTIADDRVLVRVHAASVDRGTWHIMAGLPYLLRAAGVLRTHIAPATPRRRRHGSAARPPTRAARACCSRPVCSTACRTRSTTRWSQRLETATPGGW